MRPFYTLLLLFSSFTSTAQIRANYLDNSTRPTKSQIEAYRSSIWNALPTPEGWTNDFEGIFTPEEEATLSDLIANLEEKTGFEIAVVTVDSNMVSSDHFEEFADRLLYSWEVGKKGRKNGLVICLSSQYKRITISRGAGVDRYIDDGLARKLIVKDFIPLYKKHNYYGGTLKGLISIINLLQPSI